MTTVLCFQESVHIVSRKIGNPWESVDIRAILCCKKTTESQASVDWCCAVHVWESEGIRWLACLLADGFCIVNCRNP